MVDSVWASRSRWCGGGSTARGGASHVARRQTAHAGGSRPSNGDSRRLWYPMASTPVPMDSSHCPLQNPGGLVGRRRRKSGAVVDLASRWPPPLNGDTRRLRHRNGMRPVALNSCSLPLSNHVRVASFGYGLVSPQAIIKNGDNGGFRQDGAVSGDGDGAWWPEGALSGRHYRFEMVGGGGFAPTVMGWRRFCSGGHGAAA